MRRFVTNAYLSYQPYLFLLGLDEKKLKGCLSLEGQLPCEMGAPLLRMPVPVLRAEMNE